MVVTKDYFDQDSQNEKKSEQRDRVLEALNRDEDCNNKELKYNQ